MEIMGTMKTQAWKLASLLQPWPMHMLCRNHFGYTFMSDRQRQRRGDALLQRDGMGAKAHKDRLVPEMRLCASAVLQVVAEHIGSGDSLETALGNISVKLGGGKKSVRNTNYSKSFKSQDQSAQLRRYSAHSWAAAGPVGNVKSSTRCKYLGPVNIVLGSTQQCQPHAPVEARHWSGAEFCTSATCHLTAYYPNSHLFRDLCCCWSRCWRVTSVIMCATYGFAGQSLPGGLRCVYLAGRADVSVAACHALAGHAGGCGA